jgi:hypothetical protein
MTFVLNEQIDEPKFLDQLSASTLSDLLKKQNNIGAELKSEVEALQSDLTRTERTAQPQIQIIQQAEAKSKDSRAKTNKRIILPKRGSRNFNAHVLLDGWGGGHSQRTEVPTALAGVYRALRGRAAVSASSPEDTVSPGAWRAPASWTPFNPLESLAKQEEDTAFEEPDKVQNTAT